MIDKLKEIAPNFVFSVSREIDELHVWDGDGPDPTDDGFDPFEVTVTARCVVGGEIIEGNAYMGGSYFKFGEPCGDVGGYLPQMLEEAASELGNSHQFLAISTWRTSHHGELQNAIGFIKREMKREMLDRYQAQVNK